MKYFILGVAVGMIVGILGPGGWKGIVLGACCGLVRLFF